MPDHRPRHRPAHGRQLTHRWVGASRAGRPGRTESTRGLPAFRRLVVGAVAVVIVAGIATIAACSSVSTSARSPRNTTTVTTRPPPTTPSTTPPTTAPTTTETPGSSAPGPLTSPPLPKPGAGFVAGHITAVGDSVMLDYQQSLQQDIPGITVDAAVSRQWTDGETLLQQLKSQGQLGAVVVVGLGTNGPITDADFNNMMAILQGASRVVFVSTVVGQPWQNQVNTVLHNGVARYPNAVLADWAALEATNPGWVYSDGTHLPINGPGAQALSALIASKV